MKDAGKLVLVANEARFVVNGEWSIVNGESVVRCKLYSIITLAYYHPPSLKLRAGKHYHILHQVLFFIYSSNWARVIGISFGFFCNQSRKSCFIVEVHWLSI